MYDVVQQIKLQLQNEIQSFNFSVLSPNTLKAVAIAVQFLQPHTDSTWALIHILLSLGKYVFSVLTASSGILRQKSGILFPIRECLESLVF